MLQVESGKHTEKYSYLRTMGSPAAHGTMREWHQGGHRESLVSDVQDWFRRAECGDKQSRAVDLQARP